MDLGWEDSSGDPWNPPIRPPKVISWDELIRWLGESGSRDTRASDLAGQRKDKVRYRDGYQCRLPSCSSKIDPTSPREVIGNCLHVHHIIKLEAGGQNVPSNLITLCEPCHTELHNQCVEPIPEWEQFIGVSGSDQDFLG